MSLPLLHAFRISRRLTSALSRTGDFLAARLSQSTFLGLHLTLGLIGMAAAIWLFSALLDAVLDNATLVRWDIATDRWVHAHVTPTGTAMFSDISKIGSPGAMTVLAIVGCLTLLLRG